MSTDLKTQLAAYGDLFAADLDTLTVEDAMSARLGEGPVKMLEPVQRVGSEKRSGRGPLVAAAVFVVVVALGVAVALAWRGSGQDVVDVPAPPFETGEQAAEAFFGALAGGDYDTFNALFAAGAPSHFGDASVSEQRLRERFEFEAAGQTYRLGSVECLANPVVESAWTCTSPINDESMTRILLAGELQFDVPPANEFDIALSSDGHIQRVSDMRIAGSGVAIGPHMEFLIGPFLVANHPRLDENLIWLMGTGDHGTFPLTMTPPEMSAQ